MPVLFFEFLNPAVSSQFFLLAVREFHFTATFEFLLHKSSTSLSNISQRIMSVVKHLSSKRLHDQTSSSIIQTKISRRNNDQDFCVAIIL